MLNVVIAKNKNSRDIFSKNINLDGYNVKLIDDFSKLPFKNLFDVDFILSDIDSMFSDEAKLYNQVVEKGLCSKLILVGEMQGKLRKSTYMLSNGLKCYEPDVKKANNLILEIFEARLKQKQHERDIILTIHNGALDTKVKQALEKGDSRLLNKTLLMGSKILPLHITVVREYYSRILKAVYEFADEMGIRHIEKKDLFFELIELTDFESVRECSIKKISSVVHLIEMNKKKHNRMVSEYIRDYVDENYMKQETNAGNIAERFGVSSSYIGALFKEQEKTTITKYITKKRISKAEELLKETRLQIQTISKKVGYSDQNYFARIFKKQTGLSPGEFRNKNSH